MFDFSTAFSSLCNMPSNSNEAFKISSKNLLYTMKGQKWSAATQEFHKQINQPILLIEGEKDRLVPIDDALDMIEVRTI
jgi:hypothetical protein